MTLDIIIGLFFIALFLAGLLLALIFACVITQYVAVIISSATRDASRDLEATHENVKSLDLTFGGNVNEGIGVVLMLISGFFIFAGLAKVFASIFLLVTDTLGVFN